MENTLSGVDQAVILSIEQQINEKAEEYLAYKLGESTARCRNELWELITSLFEAKIEGDKNAVIYYKGDYVGYTFLCRNDMEDLLKQYRRDKKSGKFRAFIQYIDEYVYEIYKVMTEWSECEDADRQVSRKMDNRWKWRKHNALNYFAKKFVEERIDATCGEERTRQEGYDEIMSSDNGRMVFVMANLLIEVSRYEDRYEVTVGDQTIEQTLPANTMIFRGRTEDIPFPEGTTLGYINSKGLTHEAILQSILQYTYIRSGFSSFLERQMRWRSFDILEKCKKIIEINKEIVDEDDTEEPIEIPGDEIKEDTRVEIVDYIAKMGRISGYLSDYSRVADATRAKYYCTFFVRDYITKLFDRVWFSGASLKGITESVDNLLGKRYIDFDKRNSKICQTYIYYLEKDEISDQMLSKALQSPRYKCFEEYAIASYPKNREDVKAVELFRMRYRGELIENRYKTQESIADYYGVSAVAISKQKKEFEKQMDKFERKYWEQREQKANAAHNS